MKLIEIQQQDENIFDNIIRDCQPFLRQINNEVDKFVLYRGVTKLKPVYTPSKNRLPLHTPKDVHEKLDAGFDKLLGIKPRSQGVFATGNKTEVNYYGIRGDGIIAMFPIGEFQFVWSPIVRDIVKLSDDIDLPFNGIAELYEYPDEFTAGQVGFILKQLRYRKNDDLKKAIASKNEIMILCDQYYGVPIAATKQGWIFTHLTHNEDPLTHLKQKTLTM
jgi:hypothetical protein